MTDAKKEMHLIRVRVRELISAMVDRALKDDRFTMDNLLAVYRHVIGGDPPAAMKPGVPITYECLFGFGKGARKWLGAKDVKKGYSSEKELSKLGRARHIDRIRKTLEDDTLRIGFKAPEYGDQPCTWWNFLDDAYQAINGDRHRDAGRHNKLDGVTATPPFVPDLGIARSFRSRIDMLLDEYFGTRENGVPFGGRDQEMQRLTSWLCNESASSRMLITARTGLGKTALVLRWLRSIHRLTLGTNGWQIVFMPIGILSDMIRPSSFYGGLAERLYEITNEPVPAEVYHDADAFKHYVRAQLNTLARSEQRVLVVVDGIDEALAGTFDFSIFPDALPKSMRVLASARWQIGDVDAAGWLKRLRWDGVEHEEPLLLERLTDPNVASVFVKFGMPADFPTREHALFDRLIKLTNGEPIAVRNFAQDLWGDAHSDAPITLEDLETLEPGFSSYFRRWLERQETLWKEEESNFEGDLIYCVLSILAYSHGRLEKRDLCELIPVINGKDAGIALQRRLHPLRRFIIGNGERGQGYILSHPMLGQCLREEGEWFKDDVRTIQRGFLRWGLEHLKQLNDNTEFAKDTSGYALQYLRIHFQEAGASIDQWMQFVEDGWRCAWEHFEGGPRGFSDDVQAAWDILRTRGATAEMGAQWRCALVLSSIRSACDWIPNGLIVAAAQKGVISIRQAIAFACVNSNRSAASTLAKLADLLPASDPFHSEVISTALHRAIHGHEDQAFHPLTPLLSDSQVHEAIESIKLIAPRIVRIQMLAELARCLPVDRHPELMDTALQWTSEMTTHGRAYAAPEDADEDVDLKIRLGTHYEYSSDLARMRAIEDIVPLLSPSQRGSALAIAVTIRSENVRRQALMLLVPLLSEKQIGLALAAVAKMEGEEDRELVLGTLIAESSSLPAETGLSLIASIRDGLIRARTIVALAPRLSENHYDSLVDLAIGIATAKDRGAALGLITRFLNRKQRRRALAAIRKIHDEDVRAFALACFASGILPERYGALVEEPFARAKSHGDDSIRARAFETLAPVLSLEERAEAIAIIKTFADSALCAKTLIFFALQPSAEQRNTFLAARDAARMITDPQTRATTLGSIAAHTPHDQQAEVWSETYSAINSIKVLKDRVVLLDQFAPDAPEKPFRDAVGFALEAVKLLGPWDRSEVLDMLAKHLSRDQLVSALAIARSVNDQSAQGRAFTALASRLQGDERERAVTEAILAADAVEIEPSRVEAFALVASVLEADQRQKYVNEAMKTASSIGEPTGRARALASLGEHLAPDDCRPALDEALMELARCPEEHRPPILKMLAGRILPEHIDGAYAIAITIRNPSVRAEALNSLAERLSANQSREALENTIEPVSAIQDIVKRVYSLVALAPFMPPSQRTNVLREIQSLPSPESRGEVLARIIPYLDSGEERDKALSDAFTAVWQCHEVEWQLDVLEELIPNLPKDHWNFPLDVLWDQSYGPNLARGIELAATLLPSDVVDRYMDTLHLFYDKNDRVNVLIAFAPRLIPYQHARAADTLLRNIAGCSRALALDAVAAYSGVLDEIGSPHVIMEIRRAISDVVAWYH